MNQDEQIAATLSRLNLGVPSLSSSVTSTFTNSQKKELLDLISATVSSILNPVENQAEESAIDFRNVDAPDHVPDVVKCLREFAGKPGEFNSWRKSVDRILQMYGQNRTTPKYFAILHTIRHKIIGEADAALESYRTPLNWEKIKKCLMMHYSDKRDVGTLEYQMTTLTQRGSTVQEFYQQVYQHLSLILDKIDCLDLAEDALTAMTATYRDKALDTFVRGLNGNLPSLLSVREPTSLPQALQICLKLSNLNYRTAHANSMERTQPNIRSAAHQRSLPMKRSFYPELSNPHGYFPRTNKFYSHDQNQFNRMHQNFPPQSNVRPPLPPKPPIPMEIDRSIQTRQVSYQNRTPYQNQQNFGQPYWQIRPNRFFQGNNNHTDKRPPSQKMSQPNKVQRVFNTEAAEFVPSDNEQCLERYEEEPQIYQSEYEVDEYDQINPTNDDINFLD